MSTISKANKKIEQAVTTGCKNIENGVVSGYKSVESGVVGGFRKIFLKSGDRLRVEVEHVGVLDNGVVED